MTKMQYMIVALVAASVPVIEATDEDDGREGTALRAGPPTQMRETFAGGGSIVDKSDQNQNGSTVTANEVFMLYIPNVLQYLFNQAPASLDVQSTNEDVGLATRMFKQITLQTKGAANEIGKWIKSATMKNVEKASTKETSAGENRS